MTKFGAFPNYVSQRHETFGQIFQNHQEFSFCSFPVEIVIIIAMFLLLLIGMWFVQKGKLHLLFMCCYALIRLYFLFNFQNYPPQIDKDETETQK